VFISPEVDTMRIATSVRIHPGCRIRGATSSIGLGCELGAEGPVTLEDCQLGRNVTLKGGFFSGAVFLEGSSMGNGAHVRAGTILEEESSAAHTVGLKQTILFPFVTLGSLITFCDILMTGGTSPENHSEVGSSYTHFNFTPQKDKATPSLLGDVPRGVLLNQNPIFLGGQGGLVGPRRIAYGTVIVAGGVCRKDVLEENQLHIPATLAEQTIPYEPTVSQKTDSVIQNNLIYIGNIRALKQWYETFRVHFIRDEFDRAAWEGALKNLDLILAERLQRLEQWIEKGKDPFALFQRSQDSEKPRETPPVWSAVRARLEEPIDRIVGEKWVREIERADRTNYIATVRNLRDPASITAELQSIVDDLVHPSLP